MKTTGTLLALVLLGCSSLPPAPRGEVDPRITLEFLSLIPGSGEGNPSVRLRLTNRSDRAFPYRGYSLERPFPPGLTEVRHRFRWRRIPTIDCGTGVREVSLAPNQSVDIELRLAARSDYGAFDTVRVALIEANGHRIVRSPAFRSAPGGEAARPAAVVPPGPPG